MTEHVENCPKTLKTLLSKHVIDGTSWMLHIQEGDTKPRVDLQHDDMTRSHSERLSIQAYVMIIFFEKFLIEYKTELEGVRSNLFQEGDNPPSYQATKQLRKLTTDCKQT